MNYAKIENGICVNVIVCDDETLAHTLGYTEECPIGYGINDLFSDGVWTKQTYPEVEPEPEPEPEPYVPTINDKLILSLIS